MNDIKLSIISVSYNCKKDVSKTVDSLKKQTYKDFEWVVVDGLSSDGTVEEIRKESIGINNKIILSEKDNGIYDAMNKGISLAHGEFLYFLNFGDTLYDSSTLENVVKYLLKNDVDIVYGDVIYGKTRKNSPDKLNKWFFINEKMICHQAIFAKKEQLIDGFDTQYRYCADRKWLYKVVIKGANYKHANIVISVYNLDGASSNIKKFQKDSINIIRDDFGIIGCVYVYLKRGVGGILK